MLVSGSTQSFIAMPPFAFCGCQGGSRHKFLKAEDDLLVKLVEQFGDKGWMTIAQYMKRRTARQCRERYKNYLSPAVSNRPWSEAEDELLTQKVAEYGQKWSLIAGSFDSRSDVNVKNRWSAILQRNARVQKSRLTGGAMATVEPPELFDTPGNRPQHEEEWDWNLHLSNLSF
jgi:hypothetical protein